MKAKTALAFSILALFSIGGFAQNQSSSLKSSYVPPSPEEILKDHSSNIFKLFRDNPDLKISEEAITRLNSAMENRTFIEKVDSLNEYIWNVELLRWDPLGTDYYLFDALGRNYSYWDAWYDDKSGTLIPESKAIIDWNTNYQITGVTQYNWSDTSSVWIPSYRSLNGYNQDGQLIHTTDINWNVATGGWVLDRTDTTVYDEKGLLQERESYSYDDIYFYWIPNNKDVFTYHPDGLLKDVESFYWVGDTSGYWENSSFMQYYYDELGRDTASYGSYWMGEGWEDSYRNKKEYDANGNMVLETSIFWNSEMQWWEGSYRTEYVFDGNNRLAETISYEWDRYGGIWYIYDKIENFWGPMGNIVEEISFVYDTAAMEYIALERTTWEYDMNVKMPDIAMPYYWSTEFFILAGAENLFQNKVTVVWDYIWNIELKKWDFVEVDTMNYSGLFDEPVNEADCKADFTWILGKDDPLDVSFSNLSEKSVVAWYWIFGDGKTSTARSPLHKYSKPGTYRVILTTIDQLGFCSNTMVKQVKAGNPACNAEFSVLVDTIKQTVSLTNSSEGNNLKYFWSFGDGDVSKNLNPVHTYQFPGTYPIVLTVSDDLGTCMDLYSARVKVGSNPCNAEFVSFVDSSSNTVLFRAKLKNPLNQYRWVFGDGTVRFGANQNHTFSKPGYYSASLTVSNLLAKCVETDRENLLVGERSPGGQADYIYVSGQGNTVAFTNKSLGSGLNYYWDFNDTESSEEKDPVHKYALPGYYDVCLTVVTRGGQQNTYCQKIFAGEESKDFCQAKFEYALDAKDDLKIYCTDRSFGEPDTWDWAFNDMDPSKDQNPDWLASAPGFIKIRQTIMNSANGCVDDAFAIVNMGIKSRLKAAFGYSINTTNTKAETYPVDFIGVSLGDAGKLKWSFGDGTFDSTSINPVHYYASLGSYNVCYTITNTSTGDTSKSCEWVHIWAASTKDVIAGDGGLIAYPNPFSETSQIEIRLDANSEIDLSVYDLLGRKVKTIARENLTAGTHIFNLNASDLESGNYYLILEAGSFRARQIVSVIK